MAKQKIMFEINADNRKAVQSFNRFKRSAVGSISGVAGAFGAALTTGALIAFGKQLIDQGDQIGKLSKRYGITTDALQRFQYMAEISGSSLESVDKAIKGLVTATAEANVGLKTYTRLFDDLNVDYKELAKLSPEKQFEVVAKELGKLTDKSKQVYLATKLFGRAGRELIPMLTDYNSLASEAEGHILFKPEDVAAAEAFKDSMTRLGISLSRVVVDSGFLPWLADVADRLDKTIGLSKQIADVEAGGGKVSPGRLLFSELATSKTGGIGTQLIGQAGLALTGNQAIETGVDGFNKEAFKGIDPSDIKAIRLAVENAKRY